MSKRHLLKLAAAVPVWAAVMFAPVAAHAIAPPVAYSNGALLAIEASCKNETKAISECPGANEQVKLRSRKEALVAFGTIALHTTQFATAIHCDNTFNAEVWNEHEKGLETEPIRAYGLVEGWGTAVCSGKEVLSYYEEFPNGKEAVEKYGALTVFAAAEPKLIIEETEAETCKPGAVHSKLAECQANGETEINKSQPSNFRRRKASLPWKVEVVHGFTKGGEPVSAERVGLAEFGECGPGPGEGTPTCGTGTELTEHPSKCYPTKNGGTQKDLKFQDVPQGCINVNIIIPQIPEELPFFGSQEVSGKNGVKNGLSPSKITFEEAHSGDLESQLGQTGVGTNEGTLDEIGQGGIQLLTAK